MWVEMSVPEAVLELTCYTYDNYGHGQMYHEYTKNMRQMTTTCKTT